MSLLDKARTVAPIRAEEVPLGTPFIWTSGPPWVAMSVEARDALVELADAATTLIAAFYDDDPLSAKQAQAALERLQR